MSVGQPGVPLLDAKLDPYQLEFSHPHDPPLSSSAPYLHPRPSHEASRLRADSQRQRNPLGESCK